MGVLPCSCRGCDNIMCDWSILGRYICSDCLSALRKIATRTLPYDSSVEEIEQFVLNFLRQERGFSDAPLSVEEFDRIAQVEWR